jgi:hypothetical protein
MAQKFLLYESNFLCLCIDGMLKSSAIVTIFQNVSYVHLMDYFNCPFCPRHQTNLEAGVRGYKAKHQPIRSIYGFPTISI